MAWIRIHIYGLVPDPHKYGLDPDPHLYGMDPDPHKYGLDPDPHLYGMDPDPHQYGLDLVADSFLVNIKKYSVGFKQDSDPQHWADLAWQCILWVIKVPFQDLLESYSVH